MKKMVWAVIGCGLLLASCQTRTESGFLSGAGLGAIAGAVISGSGEGALIGGALGAVSGGLIGSALDEQERQIMQQQNPQLLCRIDQGQSLSLNDIKAMAQAGINDSVIINYMQATRSSFYLTTADIIDLKTSGVSEGVINFMIQSCGRKTCCVQAAAPVRYVPATTVVIQERRGHWHHRRHCYR